MEESSKRLKSSSSENGDDRLSTLPDSLIHHILSFLPTKTTVSTITLLSHRYLRLWKNLQAFNFYYPFADVNSEQFKLFAVFVNTVLTLRHSRDIRKMRLCCGYSQPQHEDPGAYLYDSWVRCGDRFTVLSVDSWIRIAVGPYLEDLHLALFSCTDHGFRLPLSVLSCPNLHTVSLCGDIVVELEQSSAICLPSLKILQLDIGDVNVNYVGILLSGCPILETLELSFSPTSLGKLCVPSSLKSLKFTVENDIGACLEIDAPGLRCLSLTKITFDDAAAVGNLHNVKEAYLDIFSTPENESVDPLLIVLQALSGIKHLVLHCSIAKKRLLGGQPIIDFSKIQFPEFYHLRHLELILPTFDTFLYDVLQKCPMLQALIIQNNKVSEFS
ncbi:hypothetical protein TSUD_369230 [Trifolium subterraneum]|uniref:F-box domain-containing protein n=1 Tax=Trifolium subterraneum TaxID=3900 RepID=A0A2Z6PB78_TRISU|nr:hypothetical protein TSUD_369230 [Trifolium subterraneum]